MKKKKPITLTDFRRLVRAKGIKITHIRIRLKSKLWDIGWENDRRYKTNYDDKVRFLNHARSIYKLCYNPQ